MEGTAAPAHSRIFGIGSNTKLSTITSKVQEFISPETEVAVHVTMVVPIGKLLPEAGR